jgi:DNA processing protein
MGGSARDIMVLSRIPGVGSTRLRALVHRFGDVPAIARASARQFLDAGEIDRKTAAAIAEFFRGPAAHAAEEFADDQLTRLARIGGEAVTLWDPGYPSHLKTIFDPPPCLFFRGSLLERDASSIAIVGTRVPTPSGVMMAERFATALGALGITVVSGLARGIDTAAHGACVRGGIRTLAVIGSGLDVIYPPENKGLAERIAGQGAIISEYPCGTPPDAVNFPRRNRIVSGMTLGTLVVESGIDGGAMITANLAVDQGREVFAVPAPVSDRKPCGTNLLIKEGKAKLTETVDDILVELAPRLRSLLPPETLEKETPAPDISLFEKQLYDLLGNDAMHIDDLASRSGLSLPEALAHLLSLECKGAVKQLPGKVFLKT